MTIAGAATQATPAVVQEEHDLVSTCFFVKGHRRRSKRGMFVLIFFE